MVFGIFLCRGDLLSDVCRHCVVFAVNEILIRCPNEKEAVLYYEECMLRYSHQNILSTVIYSGRYILMNATNISSNQVDRFGDSVSSTMNQAAVKAENNSRKFYTIKANWTTLQSLYVLVQCTPDLRRQDCLTCLLSSINGMMPFNKTGGRLLYPTCNTRYELYQFYNEPDIRIQEDSAPSPRPGKGGNSSVIIIAVVVTVTAMSLLFIGVFLVRARNTRTVYETEPLAEDRDDITTAGSLQLDFKAIEAATDKFSLRNKLGQGGFGEVYKGTFPSGVQVAVKRLSKTSGQEEVDDRPTMSAIVQMLTTSSIALAVPRPPGFFFRSRHEQVAEVGPSTDMFALCSVDDASITSVAPR
ncbi:unnamed protein product [Arabidopsis arenosa]|uniref:Cysteine-rich receptor-like protein kinase n=1 Tax=Arabidopsis arenosa TaxID=38785 RepID=A0A8S2AVK2_ARAAE|nr:unnamed protein product [Arabidopsis arenosa]